MRPHRQVASRGDQGDRPFRYRARLSLPNCVPCGRPEVKLGETNVFSSQRLWAKLPENRKTKMTMLDLSSYALLVKTEPC